MQRNAETLEKLQKLLSDDLFVMERIQKARDNVFQAEQHIAACVAQLRQLKAEKAQLQDQFKRLTEEKTALTRVCESQRQAIGLTSVVVILVTLLGIFVAYTLQ
ncbi:hypothetical protein J8273_2736 [Carpediemonas membranifera]|uniref:Uncharacterized protein n=1 Tax=Carpediemonas membranifera TaxID=201153 RepID=A0A8J6B7F4_9EUKA|nr:hypothetical protein J8273_2736 [Carpediemonas membranifera]|eukprot:KAG9395824.1 hypothetical protein J8273_2736 [Carpediemonas membranifera]